MNLPTNLKISEVPFQPWARAIYEYRQSSTTKDDPHVRCKPSGGPRMFHTPYGMEFLDQPDLKRVYIVGVGGPHTWRVIYMDGREHPKDLDPSFSGHSVGRWDGDSLVVDTVGFNEKFWLTREGIPSTEFLHLTERFTRTDYDTLKYEATVDDPGAYTAPWTGGWYIRWQPDHEMYEYVGQDNNRDVRHMYGGPKKISRGLPGGLRPTPGVLQSDRARHPLTCRAASRSAISRGCSVIVNSARPARRVSMATCVTRV